MMRGEQRTAFSKGYSMFTIHPLKRELLPAAEEAAKIRKEWTER